MRTVSMVILSLFLFAACGDGDDTVRTSAAQSGTGAVQKTVKTKAYYLPYEEREADFRRGAMLFFAKDGDPFSVRSDKTLRSLYESDSVSVTTYRVDFATATGARLKYGVIVEDTFVLLDASGQRVAAITHPDEDALAVMVRGRLPLPSPPAL